MLLGFCSFAQVFDEAGTRNLCALITKAQCFAHTFRELLDDARPFANDRDGEPTFAAWQRFVNRWLCV